jgi:hypothetical protein
VSLLIGCEAELAISSWLISILKQIADQKNFLSTISVATCDMNRVLRFSQTIYDDFVDVNTKGVWLYDKIWFELFHLISVKYLLSAMSSDFNNLEESCMKEKAHQWENRMLLFNGAFSTNSIQKCLQAVSLPIECQFPMAHSPCCVDVVSVLRIIFKSSCGGFLCTNDCSSVRLLLAENFSLT